MKKSHFIYTRTVIFLAIILIGMILSGCGPSPEEQAATAAVLTAAAATSTPTTQPTPTITPSPTPLPESMIGSVLLSEVDGMKLIFIPGGIFLMGSTEEEIDQTHAMCQEYFEECPRYVFEDEYPQHELDLDPYWMDQTEVTIRMYTQCVEDGSCSSPVPREYYEYSRYLDEPSHANFPVIFVDWQQAQDYCTWAGRRLPTEAEWEKAARGPDGWIYPWGNTAVRGELLNYRDINFAGSRIDLSADDGYKRLAPVGNYPEGASLYGVMDLAGNVLEWVADWYDVYPGGDPAISEYFGQSVRSARGGSWSGFFFEINSALRWSRFPETQERNLGFRCALSHTEEITSRFTEQQLNQPQPTLVPMKTAESIPPSNQADESRSLTEEKCAFTSISAFTGFIDPFSSDELPIFMYTAEGFSPSERISVKLTGLSTGSGINFSMSVADSVYANGKWIVDGLLVWSQNVLGGSIPSEVEISLEGDECSLKQTVTWPYLE